MRYVSKTIIAVILILFSVYSYSQTTFQKIYPTNYNKTVHEVIETSDGGYMLCGMASTSNITDCNLLVMKINSSGDTVWTRTFGGTKPDYAFSLKETSDGNYFVTGYSQSFGGGDYDIWLLKISPSGSQIWAKTYGANGNEEAHEIIKTSDGNYVIVGQSNSFSGSMDAVLIKIDLAGTVLWTKTYGGSNVEIGNSVKQCADGGYILTGQTFSYGQAGDTYLVRTNANGDTLWTKYFGGSQADAGVSIDINTDGSFVLAVRDSSNGADVDLRVMKTDANGNQVWNKLFSGPKKDTPKSIQVTSDGGSIVGGISRSFGWINPDMWLIKLNANGDTTWTRHYGTAGHEHCHNAKQSSDGGYLAVGHSQSPNQKVMFLKLNSNGQFGPLSTVNEEQKKIDFRIYPNPSVNGSITIDLNEFTSPVMIKIVNTMGQELYAEKIEPQGGNRSTTVFLNDNLKGMYFVNIISRDFTSTRKLILE